MHTRRRLTANMAGRNCSVNGSITLMPVIMASSSYRSYHNIFGPEGAWNDGREKAPPRCAER